MKKKILALAVVVISLVGGSALAQNPSNECTNKEKCSKEMVKCKENHCPKADPFKGMNLTDAQKSKIKDLNEKVKLARKQKAEAYKAEKMKKDSAKFAERRQAKKEYLEELKAIIGPDNYVIFLENEYLSKSPKMGHKPFGNKDKGCKGHKGMKPGMHPERKGENK